MGRLMVSCQKKSCFSGSLCFPPERYSQGLTVSAKVWVSRLPLLLLLPEGFLKLLHLPPPFSSQLLVLHLPPWQHALGITLPPARTQGLPPSARRQ